jgi:hypothetical protein
VCIIAGTALLGGIDAVFFYLKGFRPQFGDTWWLALWVPILAAAAVSAWAGGAPLSRRFMAGAGSAVLIGILYAALSAAEIRFFDRAGAEVVTSVQLLGQIAVASLWRAFLFALVAVLGIFFVETRKVKRG